MDPGQGTKGEPSENPLPIVHYTPAIRHRSRRGGAMLNGAPRSSLATPEGKTLWGQTGIVEIPGGVHLGKKVSSDKQIRGLGSC